jgi:hypothetical protein
MTMYTETESSLQTDETFLFAALYKIRRKVTTLKSKCRRRQPSQVALQRVVSLTDRMDNYLTNINN